MGTPCERMRSPRKDMSLDECRKYLRYLELDAYGNMVSVLRAQGPYSGEKQKLLQELTKVLHISNERHRAEIRRAVNDEKLTTIAEQLSGPNTGLDWAKEGRRTVSFLPRMKAKTAFTTLANSLSRVIAAANEKTPLPPEVKEASSTKREIESQRELTVKDKAIADLLLEFGASMNSRKRKNPASEPSETTSKESIDKVTVNSCNSRDEQRIPIGLEPSSNKVLVLSTLDTTLTANKSDQIERVLLSPSSSKVSEVKSIAVKPVSETCTATTSTVLTDNSVSSLNDADIKENTDLSLNTTMKSTSIVNNTPVTNVSSEKKIAVSMHNGLNSPVKIITTSGHISQTLITNTRMIPANKVNFTTVKLQPNQGKTTTSGPGRPLGKVEGEGSAKLNFLNSHKNVKFVRLNPAKQSNYVLLQKGDQVQFCPSTMETLENLRKNNTLKLQNNLGSPHLVHKIRRISESHSDKINQFAKDSLDDSKANTKQGNAMDLDTRQKSVEKRIPLTHFVEDNKPKLFLSPNAQKIVSTNNNSDDKLDQRLDKIPEEQKEMSDNLKNESPSSCSLPKDENESLTQETCGAPAVENDSHVDDSFDMFPPPKVNLDKCESNKEKTVENCSEALNES